MYTLFTDTDCDITPEIAARYGYKLISMPYTIEGKQIFPYVDFEKFPEAHCKKAPELLAEVGASERLVHAVCSHGWNLTVDVKPEHFMEKVLYATDELTGLIWACSIMLPSKSVKDLQLKTIRKKFRNEQFAAGCSRPVIVAGAELLGWTLEELFERTLAAMQETEDTVEAQAGSEAKQ